MVIVLVAQDTWDDHFGGTEPGGANILVTWGLGGASVLLTRGRAGQAFW